MKYLSLFSGIGGLDLGLDRAGMVCVGQVEINPFCRAVLAKHWPEVPRHDDVRTAAAWWLDGTPRPAIDAIVGGYPCQPESVAGGRRKGTADERWLWPDMARVIHALRPRWVIGENVPGHRTSGLRFVLRDLERLGYAARAGVIRACEMGAPHPRARLFTVANTVGVDEYTRMVDRLQKGSGPGPAGETTWPDPERTPLEIAARSLRVADGSADRMDNRRVHAVGNAVVPQVAERIGRIVMMADAERPS
jgi:DNA (cytosine-5)-methyltransferase 1